jgi:hypothetical protein
VTTSDTPETDAEWDKYIRHPYTHGAGDLRILLQRLERERDEAIRQRDETNESSVFSCNFYYEEKLKAERERDEAREELKNEMKWHHRTHKELVEAQCKLLDIEYDKLKS